MPLIHKSISSKCARKGCLVSLLGEQCLRQIDLYRSESDPTAEHPLIRLYNFCTLSTCIGVSKASILPPCLGPLALAVAEQCCPFLNADRESDVECPTAAHTLLTLLSLKLLFWRYILSSCIRILLCVIATPAIFLPKHQIFLADTHTRPRPRTHTRPLRKRGVIIRLRASSARHHVHREHVYMRRYACLEFRMI